VDDYRQWPGDWELIGGIPLAMTPSPGVQHQRIGARILRQLAEALDDCPQCEALYEIDVEFARDTVVRPDVIVICFKPEGERITRAPDLIFEILSPARARRDERTKFRLYQDEGVNWYVLVDPEAKRIKVYRLSEGRYLKVGDFHEGLCPFDLMHCTIAFDVGRLWQ
ncbi:MAG: Uma2 family endonuclease, partial [Fimbriimonadales bacterium]|nr:Uma2 family endonuclease [Fimbriimonadales bacterium]